MSPKRVQKPVLEQPKAPSADAGSSDIRQTEPKTVVRLNAVWISYAHTACAVSAFLVALFVGCLLHFNKIVENAHWGYPHEWFPSVSATIGDRFPERSFYQLLIALTSGPRFLMIILSFILVNREGISPLALFIVGIARTFTCGGWTYVTSTDDHDWHDIFMIAYIVLTLPWMIMRTILTQQGTKARRWRRNVGTTFFVTIVPMMYFFVQHKVHRIAGAYTIYAFFEWSLILLDVGFDAVTALDFGDLEIRVVDKAAVVAKPIECETFVNPESLANGPSTVGFLIAIYNWFVFWSVLTSLGLCVWYFPLWFMGISGYEAMLLAILSPVLIALPFVERLLVAVPLLSFAGTAVGIWSYWIPRPSNRLFGIGVGCMFAALSLASSSRRASATIAGGHYHGAAFVLGLILSSVAKLSLWTNNPVWPVMNESNGGLNSWGLAFALLSAVLSPLSKIYNAPAAPAPDCGCLSIIGVSIGLGGLIFSQLTYLTDSSLLPLWVWTGYPLRGPTPVPFGAVTIALMGLGVFFGLKHPRITLSLPFAAASCLAAALLQTLADWPGYIAGLFLTFWLCAVSPSIINAAGRFSPAKSFGIAFTIVALLILGETWTVAYAFVPGGPALRERQWLIMAIAQLTVVVGVLSSKASMNSSYQKLVKSNGHLFKQIVRLVLLVSAVLSLTSFGITFNRMRYPTPAPRHPEEKLLTAGIWTIHFGLDNHMWASEVRMRDLIDDLDLDVIGLLESDTQRAIGGHRDITQRIAEELGFYADYGPGPNKHTWGAALLSRFPILNSTHHLTPSPVGELAPAIHATLDMYGELVDIVVFHSGQEEDVEDRRLQTQTVSNIMASSDRPLVLLSYLVTKPKQGNYNTYVSEHTGMHDIDPSDDWDRWCEYILYKKLHRVGYARVSRSTITDTELQVGKFAIGEAPNYSNQRIPESEVAEGRRFPQKLRGDGVRGHRYHVFNEPWYYA